MISRSYRSGLAGGGVVVAIALIALSYQLATDFECSGTDLFAACRFVRSLAARFLAASAGVVLLMRARPQGFERLASSVRDHGGGSRWAAVFLAGLLVALAPVALLDGSELQSRFDLVALSVLLGGGLVCLGGLLWLAPVAAWRDLLATEGRRLTLVIAVGMLVPDLAELALPLWDVQGLTGLTFSAVRQLLLVVSPGAYADPATFIIGTGDFYVHVARQCSGIEGVALMTAFTALYAVLFRDSIRFGRFLPTVLPVALAASLALNVVRIVALILIGANVSPDLAVNAFHSYAGWLFFVALALVMLYTVQSVDWLHRDRPAPVAIPAAEDPVAMMLLPFVVFMLAGIAVNATGQPVLLYPLKVVVLLVAVLSFRRAYLAVDWSIDLVAVIAGLGVGAMWIATSQGPGAMPEIPATGVFFAVWAMFRVVGTVLLVPLVEEFFFRGYVLSRLDRGSAISRVMAIAVSSAGFALLHGRWIEAGLAGLVFGLVLLRRGRVADAVVAHVMSNTVVALVAVTTGDFSLI